MKKAKYFVVLFILIMILLVFFVIRAASPRQLDDLSPGIPCASDLVEKSDVLWVIPKFDNVSIDKDWCDYVLGLNKTIGMHGVYHTYNEFGTERNREYLDAGIEIFENCFGFKPEMFKPPQLKILSANKRMIENEGLKVEGSFNQLTHKVYHCSDTGMFPNKLIGWF
jgi:predicted deacetylase